MVQFPIVYCLIHQADEHKIYHIQNESDMHVVRSFSQRETEVKIFYDSSLPYDLSIEGFDKT